VLAGPCTSGEKSPYFLSFRLNAQWHDCRTAGGGNWVVTTVPSKFRAGARRSFREAGFRAVPPAAVPGVPSFAKNAVSDAVYVQYRRLCRRRHNDRHLGLRRLVLRRSAPIATHLRPGTGMRRTGSRLRRTPTISLRTNCLYFGARLKWSRALLWGEGSC